MLQVDNLMVLGGGLMGSGIAQCTAMNPKFKSVVLHDVKQDQLDKAKARIVKDLNRIKQKKADLNVDEIVSRVTFSTDAKPGSTQNLLIIEAVPELLDLKQQLFKDMYQKYGNEKSVIMVTNTSSLLCSDIGIHIPNKERYGGLHFFNPVPRMKLVEIVQCPETSQETVEALDQYVKDIDHVPVRCKDTPGFIVNRLLLPYMQVTHPFLFKTPLNPLYQWYFRLSHNYVLLLVSRELSKCWSEAMPRHGTSIQQ